MAEERKRILDVITAPLGFFALALLIVETFLGVAVFAPIPNEFKFWCIILAVVLFLIVVLLVAIIDWNRPGNLTLEGKHHFDLAKGSISTEKETKSQTKNERFNQYIPKL